MYVLVRLLSGFAKPLLYKIPQEWQEKDFTGAVVHVPLKNKTVPAIVVKAFEYIPSKSPGFEIKEVVGKDLFPDDGTYKAFIEKIAAFYLLDPVYFYQRIVSFLGAKEEKIESFVSLDTSISALRDSMDARDERTEILTNNLSHENRSSRVISNQSFTEVRNSIEGFERSITLTTEQQYVVNSIIPHILKPQFYPALLHGLTGSGKTEVYKELITTTINHGKSVIFLLPEVSLSLQFEHLFRKTMPHLPHFYSFHSLTKPKDKQALWNAVKSKQPLLVIGVHLPVFLPISNLGLIIIDEEHENGFQEKKHPKINSKQAALLRAQMSSIPILLGSATPSLNSLHQVEQKKWHFFQLTKRFGGVLPSIKLVQVTSKQRRPHFWITKELEAAIKLRLAKKEQTIIYLNRRGFSFFIQCKECGFIFTCKNCSVSLTVHKSSKDELHMRCHYCNYKTALPNSCTECKADDKKLLKKGIGTQQLTASLQELFPQAVIARADLDSTKKKNEWAQTVQRFSTGEIDVLVGTQLITKGYHFPNVTLVGIIWADLNLHFPLFDASETTLQKLIQVAGRAGRGGKESEVIVQTIKDHDIFRYLDEMKYIDFCHDEKLMRKEANYPPYTRLAHIELKHKNADVIDKEADRLVTNLINYIELKKLPINILGPSLPLVHRIEKIESRQIFIKSPAFTSIHELMNAINKDEYSSSIFFVPIV